MSVMNAVKPSVSIKPFIEVKHQEDVSKKTQIKTLNDRTHDHTDRITYKHHNDRWAYRLLEIVTSQSISQNIYLLCLNLIHLIAIFVQLMIPAYLWILQLQNQISVTDHFLFMLLSYGTPFHFTSDIQHHYQPSKHLWKPFFLNFLTTCFNH